MISDETVMTENTMSDEVNIKNSYAIEERKMRRQQLKLACLQLANNPSVTSDGNIIHEPSKILEAAKEYYKFVRT